MCYAVFALSVYVVAEKTDAFVCVSFSKLRRAE